VVAKGFAIIIGNDTGYHVPSCKFNLLAQLSFHIQSNIRDRVIPPYLNPSQQLDPGSHRKTVIICHQLKIFLVGLPNNFIAIAKFALWPNRLEHGRFSRTPIGLLFSR
jgi:hypothetical protein